MQIRRRLAGAGCASCKQEKHELASVAILHPDLAAEWSKTNLCGPREWGVHYPQSVWWCCPGGHPDYEMTVKRRLAGSGCRRCVSLGALRPDLAAQGSAANDRSPFDYSVNSGAKVKWSCEAAEHDEYVARIADRSAGTGCRLCYLRSRTIIEYVPREESLAHMLPEVAVYWSSTNVRNPGEVRPSSRLRVWWECPVTCHSDYMASVSTRSRHLICCPDCIGAQETVADIMPALEREWSDRNRLPFQSCPFSGSTRAWWRCPHAQHPDYSSTQSSRLDGAICPRCAKSRSQETAYELSLACLHPEIAKMWSRQNERQPTELSGGSHFLAWWTCDAFGHPDHQATIIRKVKGGAYP
jgi:hypothetical protein